MDKDAALGLEGARFAHRALLSRVRSTDREGSPEKPLGGGTRPKEKEKNTSPKQKLARFLHNISCKEKTKDLQIKTVLEVKI